MSKISNSPSAATFTKALMTEFASEAREAAGDDKVLTRDEAKTMKGRGGSTVLADLALSYFKRKGCDQADLNDVLNGVDNYVALRVGKAAITHVGSTTDKRLSAQDAQTLPKELKAAYDYLKSLPGTPAAD
jgi:hypothetical protein